MQPRVLAALLGAGFGLTLQQVEEFLAGFFKGMLGDEDLPKIEKCFKDSTALENDISSAFEDLMQADLQDIIKGIQTLGKIIQTDLPADF